MKLDKKLINEKIRGIPVDFFEQVSKVVHYQVYRQIDFQIWNQMHIEIDRQITLGMRITSPFN